MVASLGLMLFNPPLGTLALLTTNITGTGLGLTEATITKDPLKAGLTVGSAALSFGAGSLLCEQVECKLRDSTMAQCVINLLQLVALLQIIPAGRGAYQLGGAAGSAATIPFMLIPDEEQ